MWCDVLHNIFHNLPHITHITSATLFLCTREHVHKPRATLRQDFAKVVDIPHIFCARARARSRLRRSRYIARARSFVTKLARRVTQTPIARSCARDSHPRANAKDRARDDARAE